MKALAIAMATTMGLFFVLTGPVQAERWGAGENSYCKSGQKVIDQKYCKENGGKR